MGNSKRFENKTGASRNQSAPSQEVLNQEPKRKLEVTSSHLKDDEYSKFFENNNEEENQTDQELKKDEAKSKASGIQSAAPNQDILKLEHKQKLEDKCAQLEENLKNQGLKVGWNSVSYLLHILELLYGRPGRRSSENSFISIRILENLGPTHLHQHYFFRETEF